MKLLGDDCWWAPRWMKRLQERLGLGETELPDERKRPTVRGRRGGLGRCRRTAAAAAAAAARPDPSRPPRARRGRAPRRRGSRRRLPAPPARRSPVPPGSRPRGRHPPGEPATTRMPAAANEPQAAAQTGDHRERRRPHARGGAAPPVREDREIESWLGELRGNSAGAPPPPRPRPQQGAEPTTAIPTPHRRGGQPATPGAEPTTAMPAQHRQPDPDATEKLTAQDERATNAQAPQRRQRRRICCAGKAAAANPLVVGFDVVGLGLDDRCPRRPPGPPPRRRALGAAEPVSRC